MPSDRIQLDYHQAVPIGSLLLVEEVLYCARRDWYSPGCCDMDSATLRSLAFEASQSTQARNHRNFRLWITVCELAYP